MKSILSKPSFYEVWQLNNWRQKKDIFQLCLPLLCISFFLIDLTITFCTRSDRGILIWCWGLLCFNELQVSCNLVPREKSLGTRLSKPYKVHTYIPMIHQTIFILFQDFTFFNIFFYSAASLWRNIYNPYTTENCLIKSTNQTKEKSLSGLFVMTPTLSPFCVLVFLNVSWPVLRDSSGASNVLQLPLLSHSLLFLNSASARDGLSACLLGSGTRSFLGSVTSSHSSVQGWSFCLPTFLCLFLCLFLCSL